MLEEPEAVIVLCVCLEIGEGLELVSHGLAALPEDDRLCGCHVTLESTFTFDEFAKFLIPYNFLHRGGVI